MTLPGVSILVSTFARTAMLAEVVECFRRQDYAGPLELLVINECHQQTLLCDVPRVAIYNAGEADPVTARNTKHQHDHHQQNRNRLVHMSAHDLLALWDDDDIYLPDFISLAVTKLRSGEPAARLSHCMTWDGRLAVTSAGHPASTVMRKQAFLRVGAYRMDDSAACTGFWTRALAQGFFHGRHHHEFDHLSPRVIRRTDPDRVRMTQADGTFATVAEFRRQLLRRIPASEPAGNVIITPAWSCDWVQFVQDHSP